ncbi:MAG TPA: hypothetical protein VGI54_02610 [Solirubrobacteraceae bacterium]|jgi:hypothetical protein
MSQAEHPDRANPAHQVTVDDVRQLMGASTPHFALQIRERIRHLIARLPADHPASIEGRREMDRLERLAREGEVRGEPADPEMPPLPSVDAHAIEGAGAGEAGH